MFCFQGMHNYQLGETSHLRVSFSKSTITPPILPSMLPGSGAIVTADSQSPPIAAMVGSAISMPPNMLVGVDVKQLSSPHLS